MNKRRTDDPRLYHYLGEVIRVVDGDTVRMDIDLGFEVHLEMNCRLYGINAPELKGSSYQAGLQAKERLTELLEAIETPSKLGVILYSKKRGKYGRPLVIIYDTNGRSINDQMIAEGFAKVALY